ncbi:MAG: hypothetical protein QXJ75_00660 [Candidatus Bathyarchaeia archaeon]
MPFWGRKKKEADKEAPTPPQVSSIPYPKIERTIKPEELDKFKSEFRISSVEREIIGDALTRLYEAAAEGKITEEERDRLAAKYKEIITKLELTMNHSQRVIGLYELEESRAELLKMFQDKIAELNAKIEDIRRDLGITQSITKSVAEIKPASTPVPDKEEKPKVAEKTPPTPRKTKADETLEKLRQDLQKQLEKLEQIEMEV